MLTFSNWKLWKKKKTEQWIHRSCVILTVLCGAPSGLFVFSWVFLYIKTVWLHFVLPCSYRLFDSSEDPVEPSEEDKPEDASPQPTGQSYAATVALPSSPPASATLMGTLVLNIKWNLAEFRHMKGTKFLCTTLSSWLEKCSDCLHR